MTSKSLEIKYKKVVDLIPYARNSRIHSESQIAQIAASIREFGWRSAILVDGENGIIAGHGRVLAALKLGIEEVPTIDGSDMTETQKKAYIITDNKIALNASWDEQMLGLELKDLADNEFNLEVLGFNEDELKEFDFDNTSDENEESQYTDKVDVPTYEPVGEKPNIEELLDDAKAKDLIASIKESSLSDEEKQFLMTAASRHIVFDYSKIANFYAHSSKECQELMEKSALVIIDFNKAIENGFVKMTNEMIDMFDLEEQDEVEQHA